MPRTIDSSLPVTMNIESRANDGFSKYSWGRKLVKNVPMAPWGFELSHDYNRHGRTSDEGIREGTETGLVLRYEKRACEPQDNRQGLSVCDLRPL